MLRGAFLTALVLPAFTASSALAAECKQEHAIYVDRAGAYRLAFEPVGSQAAAATHRFKVRSVEGDLLLDGHVMMGDEVVRSIGIVLHECPEGDATGEELAACTVWEGVIYPIDGAGALGELVPDEGADAADRLLLAGFGPALRFSNAWEKKKLSVAPWDVLTFKECGR